LARRRPDRWSARRRHCRALKLLCPGSRQRGLAEPRRPWITARRFVDSCKIMPRSRGRSISPWHRGGTTLMARSCFPPSLEASGAGGPTEPVERGFAKGALPLETPIARHSGDRASDASLYDLEARKKRPAVDDRGVPARASAVHERHRRPQRCPPAAIPTPERLGPRQLTTPRSRAGRTKRPRRKGRHLMGRSYITPQDSST
jgi:hypothetical protein